MDEILVYVRNNIFLIVMMLLVFTPIMARIFKHYFPSMPWPSGKSFWEIEDAYYDGLKDERASERERMPANSQPAVWKDPEPGTKFKKHKLDCDTCGGPLTVMEGQLAVCEFCKSQYYLEGYEARKIEPDYDPDWAKTPYWQEGGAVMRTSPYYVDGGVSVRPSPYARWMS